MGGQHRRGQQHAAQRDEGATQPEEAVPYHHGQVHDVGAGQHLGDGQGLNELFLGEPAQALDEFALWLYLQDVYWCDVGRKSVDAVVVATGDMYGAFGCLQLCGTTGHAQVAFRDTYFAFKTQLAAFIEYLQTGVRPFPFAETVELMQLVIAGIRSREEGGREVQLSEITYD